MRLFITQRPLLAVAAIGILLLIVVVAANVLIIKYRGSTVAVPTIPRGIEYYGTGEPLTYVVFGDSTTIAQGGDYDKGYVRTTARYLADQGKAVRLHNFGVSGARAADIPAHQIPRAAQITPDIVLIAVGANDVTHFTRTKQVIASLSDSIRQLRSANPKVRIIVTGAPQMGTVPRFPQPTRYFAGVQTNRLNTAVVELARDQNVTFAPIAEKTGPLFAAHPEYFAPDLFHPNNEGYATWSAVLIEALERILNKS